MLATERRQIQKLIQDSKTLLKEKGIYLKAGQKEGQSSPLVFNTSVDANLFVLQVKINFITYLGILNTSKDLHQPLGLAPPPIIVRSQEPSSSLQLGRAWRGLYHQATRKYSLCYQITRKHPCYQANRKHLLKFICLLDDVGTTPSSQNGITFISL